MSKAKKVLRKARVEQVIGVLKDIVVGHHTDSRGMSWDRMLFEGGEFIDIPDESRYGLPFDLEEDMPLSVRWTQVQTAKGPRRGLQVVRGLDGFPETTTETSEVSY